MEIERVVERNLVADVAAMAIMLYSLPQVEDEVDALVVMPGLGEHWRLTDAIDAWQGKPAAQYLLVAGHNPREYPWFRADLETLKKPPFKLTRLEGVVIGGQTEQTAEQADWIVTKAQELELTSLALFVSPYHLLRAYCTVLKAFGRAGVKPIPMIPAPVAISPTTLMPENKVSAWDMVPGEIKRLVTYQEKGDTATYEELKEYLDWLWETFEPLQGQS